MLLRKNRLVTLVHKMFIDGGAGILAIMRAA